MSALELVGSWPVDNVAAAIIGRDQTSFVGDTDRRFKLASLSKPLAAWAIMVGVEEGIVELDRSIERDDVPDGVTMRHLLAHAAGYGFDGEQPIAIPERRRIYSNTGFDRAAAVLADAARMPFAEYLREAVFLPLAMSASSLAGSAAHGVTSTVADMSRFVSEMLWPRLIAPETQTSIITPQFPDLGGIVPEVGRFQPCPWGLGVEILGTKSPHWMGRANSAASFGHFGGAGTMMWADPLADLGVVALTDRRFGDWADEALRLWPAFSDAVLAEGSTSP